jgi:predicted nucleic acid-binding protein
MMLTRYLRLLRETPLVIVSAIDETATSFWSTHVGAKDAHVAAAAEAIGATYLLTFDKRLAAGVQRSGHPLEALSPGEFINTHLVGHPDREQLRDSESL